MLRRQFEFTYKCHFQSNQKSIRLFKERLTGYLKLAFRLQFNFKGHIQFYSRKILSKVNSVFRTKLSEVTGEFPQISLYCMKTTTKKVLFVKIENTPNSLSWNINKQLFLHEKFPGKWDFHVKVFKIFHFFTGFISSNILPHLFLLKRMANCLRILRLNNHSIWLFYCVRLCDAALPTAKPL